MKLKEKPQYGIWRNVCFMVRVAWHTAKSVLAVCITAAIINVLLNLVQLYIAPEILVRVEQHTSLQELLMTIAFFTAALFILMGLKAYFNMYRQAAEIDVRIEIMRLVVRKTCETSYPNIRDPQLLKLQDQAFTATSGNAEATERI